MASRSNNAYRLSKLLLDGGTYFARELLLQEIATTGFASIDTFLNDQTVKNKLVHLKSRKILKQSQLDILYPPSNSVQIDQFDITILTCVLLNCCNLTQAQKDSVQKLRDFRNTLYGHSPAFSLDDAIFQQQWKDVATFLTQETNTYLQQQCSTHMSDLIKGVEGEVLTTDVAEKYLAELIQCKKTELQDDQEGGRRSDWVDNTQTKASRPRLDPVPVRKINKNLVNRARHPISNVQGMSQFPGSSTQQSTSNSGQVYKALTLQKALNVSLDSDERPCDTLGTVMVQDKIIVTDQANFKLKVFDSSYRFQFEYKCDDKPCDVDTLDNTTIVVSSELGRNMKVLSLGNTSMAELNKIQAEYPCLGVCCLNGEIYCVLSAQIGSEMVSDVRVYKPDGTLRRRFEYLSDGKIDCNALAYITINPQTGTLYITDWKKGVVSLPTRGDGITVMSPPQLKHPLGIAVDDHDHIYVCGRESYNVIQMSADGNNAIEILSNNARCIVAQCVKIYGSTLLLARRHSDTVCIYKLS